MGKVVTRDSVIVGTTEIAYTIRRSAGRKTMAITVCGPWVEVAAPAGMRASAIRCHLESKMAWVIGKLDRFQRGPVIYPGKLEAGGSVRLLGRQHAVRLHDCGDDRPSLKVVGRAFHLYTPTGSPEEIGKALIKRHFRTVLGLRIEELLSEVCRKIRVPTPDFQVRELGNRWGSCSRSGRVHFHWLLATQAPSFIRHVVVHEACHLIEPRHSKRFRHLVARLEPNSELLS